ncbi:hypothetical protein HK405_000653, partial [Cladochytrium tenue]
MDDTPLALDLPTSRYFPLVPPSHDRAHLTSTVSSRDRRTNHVTRGLSARRCNRAGATAADPWLPPRQPSWITAPRAAAAAAWAQVRKAPLWLMALYQLKRRGVSLKDFKADATRLYIGFNEALASGDRERMEAVATLSMAALMNAELKRMRRAGGAAWRHDGPVRVATRHLVYARAQDPAAPAPAAGARKKKGEEDGLVVCQITVEVESRQ